MSNHRYSKFWWADWQRDSALRMCSLAARGLWMELLCIAHEGTPSGHVTINGVAPSNTDIAAICGRASEKEVTMLLAELERRGVFSRTADGTIYSRRMVRDATKSETGSEWAAKRWANGGPNGGPNGSATGPPHKGGHRGTHDGPQYSIDQKSEVRSQKQRTPQTPLAGARGALLPFRNGFSELVLRENVAEPDEEAPSRVTAPH